VIDQRTGHEISGGAGRAEDDDAFCHSTADPTWCEAALFA
jgi:hypothetical protein